MANELPAGLHQVLQVYRLVRSSAYDRRSAVWEVARQRRVDPQTISSAWTRGLWLTTNELDDLLHPQHAQQFRKHLVRRFPTYQSEISEFLATIDPAASETDHGTEDRIV